MGKPELGIKFTRRLENLGLTYTDMPELARRLKEEGFEFRDGSFADRANGEARHHAVNRIAAAMVRERRHTRYSETQGPSSDPSPSISVNQQGVTLTIQINVSIEQLPGILRSLGVRVGSGN